MFELKLDEATLDRLTDVMSFIDGILECLDCPMRAQMQIDVAVEEIYVNIASYAYTPGTGPACLQVELREDPRTLLITFIDSGVPYDPLAKPDPDISLPASERQIGGLGIFMVKKTMDDMIYEYRDGQNVLTLVKVLA